jgi:hypothetical protein
MSTKKSGTYSSRSASSVRARRIVRDYLRAAIVFHATLAFDGADADSTETAQQSLVRADALLSTLDGYKTSDVPATYRAEAK